MWVLTLSVANKKLFLSTFTNRQRLSGTWYPLKGYHEDGKFYSVFGGFLFGALEKKRQAIEDLRKNEKVLYLEYKDDFVVVTVAQPTYMETLLHHAKVFHVQPMHYHYQEKRTTWKVASFERQPLEELQFLAEEYVEGKVLSFGEERVTQIQLSQSIPTLTNNQQAALDLAVAHGYYSYPRKITLPQLAKMKGIAYSTFQAHLRKAEAKVLPSIYRGH